MMRPFRRPGKTRREGGAVLVMTALALPLLIAVCGFTVDIGNWFLHKRHLQTQADAAALAAAGEFRVPCTNDPIHAMAAKYASVDEAGLNPQEGKTELDELWQETNSETFHAQESPVDDTVVTGEPCDAKMIDVKLTETDLPWWLKAAQVPFINAQARVEIRKKKKTVGALPVAVPEVGPKRARAIFVNETTGAVIDSVELVRTPSADEDNDGLAVWSNIDAPKAVAIDTAHIGVRIVLSGNDDSVTCSEPLVSCFGAGTSDAIVAGQPGLVHIRGWSNATAGTATAPVVKDVDMVAVGCEDAYFTALAASYPCTVDINPIVDFGGAPLTDIRVYAKKTGANNNANNLAALTPPSAPGEPWLGGGFSIAAGTAGNSFDLVWRSGCNADRTVNCNTTVQPLGTVQRTFAASSALNVSGPIQMLNVSDINGPGANTFERCSTCTQELVVTLGLQPTLENASSVDDPVVSLKVAGGGSQNQALDCDPDVSNLRDELAAGCGAGYVPNTGDECPETAPDLYDTVQPWDCVPNNTGATVGQVTQGMNLRILGDQNATTCSSPNNWADFPDFDPSDPRIVEVFIVPFGSFEGSGQEVVPISNFATFYVTGWHNGGCQGDGDDPAGQGEIVGHFIKYIDRLNEGEAGEEFCDFAAFGSCVAVLTR